MLFHMIRNLKSIVIKSINYNYFAIALIVIVIILMVTKYQLYIVSGDSMEPTLYSYQIVLGDKKVENFEVNDIVVVNSGNDKYIKRIAAVKGMTIACSDNKLIINEVIRSKYYCNGVYKLKLTNNEYYVLGDNAEISKDSRDFGLIKNKDIEAKIKGA